MFRRFPHRFFFVASLALALSAAAASSAALTVTTTSDNGPGSLPQAIADAAPGDTINFDLLTGSTIQIASPQLVIDKNLIIAGLGLRY